MQILVVKNYLFSAFFKSKICLFVYRNSTIFGWPTIAVDTHIYRVSNRTKLAMGKTVEKVEEKLLKVVPAEFKVDVHHWLILHGRYT
jgi:endonuclease III